MMWLFATLVVLALGGIAMVAAGKGGALPPAYDDRPDTELPTGAIGPESLRRVRFPTAFRGYRMAEVDALLDRLAAQMDSGEGFAPRSEEQTGDESDGDAAER